MAVLGISMAVLRWILRRVRRDRLKMRPNKAYSKPGQEKLFSRMPLKFYGSTYDLGGKVDSIKTDLLFPFLRRIIMNKTKLIIHFPRNASGAPPVVARRSCI